MKTQPGTVALDLLRRFVTNDCSSRSRLDATAYLAAYRNFRALFAPLATEAGATVIEPILTLCRSTERCGIGSVLDPVYFDDSHLSVAYARDHATWIDVTMK